VARRASQADRKPRADPDGGQGLSFPSGFYWDQSEASRAFAQHFREVRRVMPTRNQAAVYAASLHFLKAVAQAGTRDAEAVNQAMRALPLDYFGHPATIWGDGRVLYDVTLYRVKSPGESKAATRPSRRSRPARLFSRSPVGCDRISWERRTQAFLASPTLADSVAGPATFRR
jgi:ABC-type branched-subunit amino acid transport system substrate-binding protein